MSYYEKLLKLTKELNVMYVEDEFFLREDNAETFENFYRNVDTAVDGKDGLKKYISYYKKCGEYYDIVITDINMPNMDGHEMIDEIHKINPDQTIVVISAYNESERLVKLIDQGVDSFILKPIESKNLISALYKASQYAKNSKRAKEYEKCLKDNNAILEQKVNEQLEELRKKDEILFKQSKLAALGEMMDAIAHQWKQPLNAITLYSSRLKYNSDFNEVTTELIDETNATISTQVNHLLETIDEFRTFFRPNFILKEVEVEHEIESILSLMNNVLNKNYISVDIISKGNTLAQVIPTEFKHIIINLINNSKDAFNENDIKERKVSFEITENEKEILVNIKDNAGGIPKEIIENIFKANFTTKEEGKGTGVGLYMSKMIIEKIGGTINVSSSRTDTCFKITIPKIIATK